jgi:hypothetical protein
LQQGFVAAPQAASWPVREALSIVPFNSIKVYIFSTNTVVAPQAAGLPVREAYMYEIRYLHLNLRYVWDLPVREALSIVFFNNINVYILSTKQCFVCTRDKWLNTSIMQNSLCKQIMK